MVHGLEELGGWFVDWRSSNGMVVGGRRWNLLEDSMKEGRGNRGQLARDEGIWRMMMGTQWDCGRWREMKIG